jgi:hypothetical protein
MAKHLPAPMPATRVVHYVDPVAHRGELLHPTAWQLAAHREEQHALYLKWKVRQAEIAERDRRVRRFLFGFGTVIGLAVLVGIVLVVWLLAHVLAGLGLLAIPLVLFAGSGLVLGGHRCVTVIQHWH